MSQQLINLLSQFAPLTEAECQQFLQLSNQERYARGDTLIQIGSACTRMFWVQSGVARHFYYSHEGKEVTTWFSQLGDLVTDMAAFTLQQPATFVIEALTDMEGVSLTGEALQTLYDESKNWERIGRLFNQAYLIRLIERGNDMAVKSARQRYEAFFAAYGHLFNQVPLKHIASYLGITLETLSRLRAGTYD